MAENVVQELLNKLKEYKVIVPYHDFRELSVSVSKQYNLPMNYVDVLISKLAESLKLQLGMPEGKFEGQKASVNFSKTNPGYFAEPKSSFNPLGKIELVSSQKKVIIMRGLPGSGKSTKAKKYNGTIVSADDFFMEDGKYKFDPSKIAQAHAECKRKFEEALKRGDSIVVVDNTNTMGWEYQPYTDLAKQYDYSVEIDAVGESTPSALLPKQLAERNVHEVPPASINRMIQRWEGEPFNPEIGQSISKTAYRKDDVVKVAPNDQAPWGGEYTGVIEAVNKDNTYDIRDIKTNTLYRSQPECLLKNPTAIGREDLRIQQRRVGDPKGMGESQTDVGTAGPREYPNTQWMPSGQADKDVKNPQSAFYKEAQIQENSVNKIVE